MFICESYEFRKILAQNPRISDKLAWISLIQNRPRHLAWTVAALPGSDACCLPIRPKPRPNQLPTRLALVSPFRASHLAASHARRVASEPSSYCCVAFAAAYSSSLVSDPRDFHPINKNQGATGFGCYFTHLSPFFSLIPCEKYPRSPDIVSMPKASPEAPKIPRKRVFEPKLCPREARFLRYPGFIDEYYFKSRSAVRASSYHVSA